MRKSVLVAAAALCAWPVAVAAQNVEPAPPNAADEATKFVTSSMDKFNGGDVKGWLSSQTEDAVIVDEFGRHIWTGKGSAQQWLDDYMADSKTKGVTAGRVDYEKPLQATSDGSNAYVVLPTTYRFMQNGQKMAAGGSMTFVLKKSGNDWKISSWTYSGASWAPEQAAAKPQQ